MQIADFQSNEFFCPAFFCSECSGPTEPQPLMTYRSCGNSNEGPHFACKQLWRERYCFIKLTRLLKFMQNCPLEGEKRSAVFLFFILCVGRFHKKFPRSLSQSKSSILRATLPSNFSSSENNWSQLLFRPILS